MELNQDQPVQEGPLEGEIEKRSAEEQNAFDIHPPADRELDGQPPRVILQRDDS